MAFSSKIGLGTVQFGLDYGISNKEGKTSYDEVVKILDTASHVGLDTIDTARLYGESESVIGKIHSGRFKIVSKFVSEGKIIQLNNQLNETLSALQTDSIYGYLAHRPMEVIGNPLIWKELLKFKENGIVTKIGFSFNDPLEYFELKRLDFIPDLIQIPCNYFDNRFLEIAKEVKGLGGEVHARSALLQGLFVTDTKNLSGHFDSVRDLIFNLQQQFGQNLPAALLKFVCKIKEIDKVILGVNNHKQLRENIELLSLAPNLEPIDIVISEQILIPSNWK